MYLKQRPGELEKLVEIAKIQSTEASNAIGWHEDDEDKVPFIKYMLGIILSAYKDFGGRFELVEEKLSAPDTVRRASLNKIGRFTKQDIRELCPSLSLSSVESALRKLVLSGALKREEKGKNTYYYRLN